MGGKHEWQALQVGKHWDIGRPPFKILFVRIPTFLFLLFNNKSGALLRKGLEDNLGSHPTHKVKMIKLL